MLHNQKESVLGFDDLIQLDDVRVLYNLEDVDLSGYPLDVV